MDIRAALKEQYHGGLAMLRQAVERCPDDLWTTPSPRVDDGDRIIFRPFWRIAFHTAYFTHLYIGQNEAAFQSPPSDMVVRSREDCKGLWEQGWDMEPFELEEHAPPSSQTDILEYIDFVERLVEPIVDTLDLDTDDSGFPWYKRISKLSHELMNLRHLQGHAGQLSELLMARGIDIDWKARA